MQRKYQPGRLVNFAAHTLRRRHVYDRREGEDCLDHLHRLAKLNLKPETISRKSGVPLESVRWWMRRNGYG